MQQRTMDRWIEEAEARRICLWATAEQAPVQPTPPSRPGALMEKLRAMVMLGLARLPAACVDAAKQTT